MKRLLAPVLLFLGSSHAAATVILTEDFESPLPPTGWTRTQEVPSVGWEFGTDLGSAFFPIPAHTRYAASNDDAHDDSNHTQNNASADRLITPVLNLSGYNGQAVSLKFAYLQPGTYGSIGTVEVSLNGGAFVQIAQVPSSAQWSTQNLSLTAYAGLSNVRVAFRHNDGGNWADGFAIDDMLIETVPARDAAMEGVGGPAYIATGFNPVFARISNQGGDVINSLGYAYSVDGGPIQSATVSPPGGIPPGGEAELELLGHDFATSGDHIVQLMVTSVNGGADQNSANDEAQGVVRVLSQVPQKRVVLEQHTGSWCQFCPDGTVVFEQVQGLSSGVIGVSIHNSDAMTTAEGDQVATAFTSAYPTGTVDRTPAQGMAEISMPRGNWVANVSQRLQTLVPASVQLLDVSYDAGVRQLTATTQAAFYGSDGGDLRLNLWVVEDGVTGVGSGYDQANYYNTQAGHPFFGAGNPIIGFVHDGVVRAMLGGAWGTAGVIPMSVADGGTYSTTYQYTLGPDQIPERIRLVGVLSRYGAGIDQREIINATQQRLLIDVFANGFE